MTAPEESGTLGFAPGCDLPASAVLIVDDDDSIRTLSKWVIQRAGYSVLTARDGPEAIECYARELDHIGLVLLDLTMPRMTGAEVLAELRKFRKRIPVVLITGYGEDALRDEERVGVAGVIQKPFSPETLRTLLARYIPAAARKQPA